MLLIWLQLQTICFETFLGTVTSMNVAMAWEHNNPIACVSFTSPPLVSVILTSSDTIAVLFARMWACVGNVFAIPTQHPMLPDGWIK
jgi:hypothetical protein